MITSESVKDYINQLHGIELFTELDDDAKEKVIFTAHELLKDNFKESLITDRVIALQVLYMIESDELDFGSLKNQGVTSYSVKGVSVSFGGSENKTNNKNRDGLIAPAVLTILNKNSGAKVGRLI